MVKGQEAEAFELVWSVIRSRLASSKEADQKAIRDSLTIFKADTPGVGGLNAGHAAATLAFLPSADALVFVTDASAELSAAELEFLASARTAGPPVLVTLTKIDMYPEWRRILDIDAGHLAAIGLPEPPTAVSSLLHLRPDEVDAIGVKLSQMELRRPRAFGNCWLGCEIWRLLELDEFWREKLCRKGGKQ